MKGKKIGGKDCWILVKKATLTKSQKRLTQLGKPFKPTLFSLGGYGEIFAVMFVKKNGFLLKINACPCQLGSLRLFR
jgi:hypothetical protein